MMNITATVFYAYQVCPREAWFYYHHINPPQDQSLLILGKLIHEISYQRARKEIFVDNLLKIDLFRGKLVAEVKRSSRHKEAAKLQLAYYLYYLKSEKGLNLKGVLLFPRERLTEEVILTPDLEGKVKRLLAEMQSILSENKPPSLRKIKYCKSCSFREICWA